MKPVTTKPHFAILDGLRGVAAILVLIYHLLEALFWDDLSKHPVRHGYLAVDFFFLLSGYVVGYAYDDRWQKMSVWQFFKIRLVRLHPMVILSVVIGVMGFCADPFTNGLAATPWWKLLLTTIIAMTLLPQPDIRGWNETHSLVGPCWSLLQEYIGNLLYALWVHRLGKIALTVLVMICGGALIWVGSQREHLGTGWGYDTFYIGLIRMLFPFFAGILIFRLGRTIKLAFAFPVAVVLLLLLFLFPWGGKYNGLLEVAIIMLGFPLIVLIGAGGTVNGTLKKINDFAGAISYPLYITHYPFIYIYTAWVVTKKPATSEIIIAATVVFFASIALAYCCLKFYDEPVRNWLKRKWLSK